MKRTTILAILSIAVPLPPFASAQTIEQAEKFVRSIYKQYDIGDAERTPDFTRAKAPSVFTPSLVQLLRRGQRNTPAGDEGKLGSDPVCDCQDFQYLRIESLVVTKDTERKASVSVTIQLFAHDPSSRRAIRLRLAWVNRAWRIDDIETKQTPSLRKLLR